MLLALSIISSQAAALGAAAYKVFDEHGGTIGRVAGNDWVLPDPDHFVSSRHANVRWAAGGFYLEDTSSNGTFLNAPDQAVSRTTPARLQDGDRLFIGEFEIIAQLIDAVAASPTSFNRAERAQSPAAAATQTARAEPVVAADVAGLLTALGLDPAQVDPAVQQQFGAILRIAVQGLMDILKSRAEVKGSFRLPITSIKPVENNPLKFSTNVEDALFNLFIKRNPGYLGPIEAFEEGFRDAAFHQVAMLAGVRAAFNALLAKFHPTHLEEVYRRKLRRTALLGLGGPGKFWELYRQRFEEIDRDREANFQLLLGDEFARVYNEHLQKLAADARLCRHRA